MIIIYNVEINHYGIRQYNIRSRSCIPMIFFVTLVTIVSIKDISSLSRLEFSDCLLLTIKLGVYK